MALKFARITQGLFASCMTQSCDNPRDRSEREGPTISFLKWAGKAPTTPLRIESNRGAPKGGDRKVSQPYAISTPRIRGRPCTDVVCAARKVTHGSAFAASRTCSARARTEKFSVTIRQRIDPSGSIRNSAGRAMSRPLASSSA